jgi:hypothetical protein
MLFPELRIISVHLPETILSFQKYTFVLSLNIDIGEYMKYYSSILEREFGVWFDSPMYTRCDTSYSKMT